VPESTSSHEDSRGPFEIAALAASAGGVVGLGRLLSEIREDFPIPLVVVQHLDPRHRTVIAEVLGRRSRLAVKLAEEGETIVAGTVYIAPPDHHLLVGAGGVLSLTRSELVHFVRPSADLLFESVAGAYGDRALACLLTGTGKDGAMGVTAVHSRGGTVIVEDPETAEFAGMPRGAIATGEVDFVLPLEEIAGVMSRLVESR
jgi:two-component system chemotaxis response regulator CheB